MKRLLGIAVLILALVGLSAPSVSLAAGVTGHAWTTGHSQVSVSSPAKVVSCKSLGGKRVLPCHPDQGVMTSPLTAAGAMVIVALMQNVTLPALSNGPEAELPPPRLA